MMIAIIEFLVKIVYKIYPYSLNTRLRIYRSKLYSIWARQEIGDVGEKVYFSGRAYIKNGKYFSIGNNTKFHEHAMLSAWDNHNGIHFTPQVIIGDSCSFGDYIHITCCNKITIGNALLTGMHVIISDNNHGDVNREMMSQPPLLRPLSSKGEIVIENNVWIGDKVSILGGVRIGEGAIIAANAVVTKDVPAYSVVGGVPSRVLRQY